MQISQSKIDFADIPLMIGKLAFNTRKDPLWKIGKLGNCSVLKSKDTYTHWEIGFLCSQQPSKVNWEIGLLCSQQPSYENWEIGKFKAH